MRGDGMLLWCDLETSGTDESKDVILETAFVLTTMDLEEVGRQASVVKPVRPVSEIRNEAAPVVQKMHHRNGLWAECEKAILGIKIAEQSAMLMLEMAGLGPHEAVLAGSGVSHFDRRFLRAQMPELESWLRYYSIDVGVLRRTLQIVGRTDLLLAAPGKGHRAMSDVLLHLDELRHLKAALRKEATL